MSKMKAAAKNIDAILESLANANCPNECRCIFCRTFDQGYQAGLEDALTTAKRRLADFSKRIK